MESLDQHEELLSNLKQTRILIKRNLQANSRLDSLQLELTKTKVNDIFALLGVLVGLIMYFSIFDASNLSKATSSNQYYFHLLPFILFAISIFVFIRLGKTIEKEIFRKRFDKRKSKIDEINSVIKRTYEESERLSILPSKYRNIYTIDKIQDYIKNKRADSFKEALNLYEDEMMRIEQMKILNNISQQQEHMIQQQKATNRRLAW